MDWDVKDAEKLLHLCDFLIKTGEAKGAVDVLQKWQAGVDHSSQRQTGGGRPLP
jgi:hypothetical protein